MIFICIGGMDTDEIFIELKLTAKALGYIIDAEYSMNFCRKIWTRL